VTVDTLLIAPIAVPLAAALLSFALQHHPVLRRATGIAGAAGLLAAAVALLVVVDTRGIQATHIGAWPGPLAIVLVADLFSAIMVVLGGIIGLATALYAVTGVDDDRERFGFYALLNVLLAGVSGAFLTGDLFNLYVWFEVMLIASFVLIALGGGRPQVEGAIKYVTLNLVSTALLLAAIGVVYGMTGTLNMAELSQRLAAVESRAVVRSVALLFLVAFSIKAAAFPFFFWLPASYHTPPAAISALFAGLLTKVGVYAAIRFFTLLVPADEVLRIVILAIAGGSMLAGVLGAIAQHEMRRVLSFHIVSQIGYMLMGLGLFTPLALAGSIFYIVHHIIVKANLFLVSGVVHRLRGTYELAPLGGLMTARPLLAACFVIPAASLAGLPPLSGFFAKFALVRAGLDAGQFAIVGVALAVSLLTLFSMAKIWREVFWKPAPEGTPPPAGGVASLIAPVVALALFTIAIGFGAEPALRLSVDAAAQLTDSSGYLRAVMGEGAVMGERP
jgi:multicomponent Na+:H+ antiporter subunit D